MASRKRLARCAFVPRRHTWSRSKKTKRGRGRRRWRLFARACLALKLSRRSRLAIAPSIRALFVWASDRCLVWLASIRRRSIDLLLDKWSWTFREFDRRDSIDASAALGCLHPVVDPAIVKERAREIDVNRSCDSFDKKQRLDFLATRYLDKSLACRNELCERDNFVERSSKWHGQELDCASSRSSWSRLS